MVVYGEVVGKEVYSLGSSAVFISSLTKFYKLQSVYMYVCGGGGGENERERERSMWLAICKVASDISILIPKSDQLLLSE